jgi:hypothetical protein
LLRLQGCGVDGHGTVFANETRRLTTTSGANDTRQRPLKRRLASATRLGFSNPPGSCLQLTSGSAAVRNVAGAGSSTANCRLLDAGGVRCTIRRGKSQYQFV